MSYQVFIERAKNPGNVNLVAGAIGDRYGLPAEALAKRMNAGRFRVKKDVDLPTARQFAAELDSMGAVASIVDSNGKVIGSGADAAELGDLQLSPEQPPVSAQIPTASSPSSDNPFAGISTEGAGRATDSPLAGISSEPKAMQEDTGLSLARAGNDANLSLGALDGGGEDLLSLASIDGEDSAPVPVAKEVGPSKATPMADEAAFLPPEATSAAPVLEVDAVLPEKPPVPEPAPAAVAGSDPGVGDVVAGGDASLGEGRAGRDSPFGRMWDALNEDNRKRFAFGILLVTLIGIVPMHLYASMSEDDSYGQMRQHLAATQALVEDVQEWENLEPLRQKVAERMDDKRVNIAITGGIIWLLCAGGLGFVYFRKLPWDDLGPRVARHDDPGSGLSTS